MSAEMKAKRDAWSARKQEYMQEKIQKFRGGTKMIADEKKQRRIERQQQHKAIADERKKAAGGGGGTAS